MNIDTTKMDPLNRLIYDILRAGWQDLCWLIRQTRKSLRDDR